jgi:predicted dehydrogenase
MSDKIRIGIIGVGQIGKHHIANYRRIEGAQIVAAADVNAAELARVADEHGIPATCGDFRELLARDDVDAVDVCLHNNFHMPVTVAALEAGKHVYCEKPMAGAYADAARMLECAAACDRRLSIQLAGLYSKETRAAQVLIRDGHVGRIYHARSTGFRRRGRPFVDGYGSASFVKKAVAAGGALYDMGVYHISQILHLIGMPAVERISGKVYQETDVDPRRREESRYDVEELGLGLVRMAGGVTVDIIESWAAHLNSFEGSSLLGSKGGIRLAPFGYYHNLGDMEASTTIDLDQAVYRWKNVYGHGNEYDGPQEHWIAALQGRVPLIPSAACALNTMLISEGIYLSDRLGREVTAEEVREHSVSTSLPV